MANQEQLYLMAFGMLVVAAICRAIVVWWYGREQLPPEDQYEDDSWGFCNCSDNDKLKRHPSEFKSTNDKVVRFEESMK